MSKQLQQGDVWFEEAKIPDGAVEITEKKDGVFAYGEGHHVHQASIPDAVKFFTYNDKTYARFLRPVSVKHNNVNGGHGQHEGLKLLATDYEYGHVREVDHFAKLARKVVD